MLQRAAPPPPPPATMFQVSTSTSNGRGGRVYGQVRVLLMTAHVNALHEDGRDDCLLYHFMRLFTHRESLLGDVALRIMDVL